MISAIIKEVSKRLEELEGQTIHTIYFGGGTPSILKKNELERILVAIRTHYDVDEEAEITLEANPEDIHSKNLRNWREIGINRLSIGLQSFRESDLVWMNRAHSVGEAKNAVHLAKECGFENITVDLIYGLPGLSLEEWKNHVQQVIEMDVPHVSAYCLTVERKTALHHRVRKGELKIPDDELQAVEFNVLIELRADAGLEQYEISNFALQGWESRHNSSYWKGISYIGIGPSAHSYDGSSRRWNVAHNRKYIDGVGLGTKYWEEEILSAEDRFNELLLTGLRTREGVDLSTLKSLLAPGEEFQNSLNRFVNCGWIVEDKGRFYLTSEGKLRADFIALGLFVIGNE